MRAWLVAAAIVGGCTEATPRQPADAKPADAKPEPKPEVEGDDKGLADKVREIAGGTRDELPEGVRGVAIPSPIPTGDIIVMHACSHSMQPFGTGYWSSSTTADLVRRELVTARAEGDTADPGATKQSKHVNSLAQSDVTRIRAALDGVLRGGPYEELHAVPEGIVCTL